jgi:O-acetylserine/cysteine efflux transporter
VSAPARRAWAGPAGLVAATGGWGSLAVTTKAAESAFGPMTLLVIELAAAALVLVTACVVLGVRLPRPGPALLALGLLEPGIAYLTFNAGVQRTSSSHASLVLGLETVFVVLFGIVFLRDRPTPRALVGTAVAVAGVMLLGLGPSQGSSPVGDLLVLAVATGLVGSAAAFLLYAWALTRVAPSTAGASLTLTPLVGLLLSVVALGEALTARAVVAAVLIVLGLAVFAVGPVRAP